MCVRHRAKDKALQSSSTRETSRLQLPNPESALAAIRIQLDSISRRNRARYTVHSRPKLPASLRPASRLQRARNPATARNLRTPASRASSTFFPHRAKKPFRARTRPTNFRHPPTRAHFAPAMSAKGRAALAPNFLRDLPSAAIRDRSRRTTRHPRIPCRLLVHSTVNPKQRVAILLVKTTPIFVRACARPNSPASPQSPASIVPLASTFASTNRSASIHRAPLPPTSRREPHKFSAVHAFLIRDQARSMSRPRLQ